MMQNKKPLFRTVLCRKAALCFFFLPLQAEACGPAPLFKSEPSIIRRKRIILPCARHAAGHESAALLSVHTGFFCCAKGLSFSPFCFSGHIFIQKRSHFHVICYFLYCNMNQAGVQYTKLFAICFWACHAPDCKNRQAAAASLKTACVCRLYLTLFRLLHNSRHIFLTASSSSLTCFLF